MAEVAPSTRSIDNKDGASFQEQFHAYLYKPHSPQTDDLINFVEQKTSLKREQLAYGIGGLLSLYLIFGDLAQTVSTLIGFVGPAYSSVKAIRTETKDDDTKLLTYWCVFGFITLLDTCAEVIMHYFPIYYLAKSVFLIYIQIVGADNVYKAVVDPTINLFDKWLSGNKEEKKE